MLLWVLQSIFLESWDELQNENVREKKESLQLAGHHLYWWGYLRSSRARAVLAEIARLAPLQCV